MLLFLQIILFEREAKTPPPQKKTPKISQVHVHPKKPGGSPLFEILCIFRKMSLERRKNIHCLKTGINWLYVVYKLQTTRDEHRYFKVSLQYFKSAAKNGKAQILKAITVLASLKW
jgi:hypothetical protein